MRPYPISLWVFMIMSQACLLAQNPWSKQSINNAVIIALPFDTKESLALEFISGWGVGDKISIASSLSGKVAAELKKPGDSFLLKPGQRWKVTFTPNFGQDGSNYLIKFMPRPGTRKGTPQRGRSVTFKAEKPVDTVLSLKAKRKLILTPGWDEPCLFPAYLSRVSESLAPSGEEAGAGI